MAELVVPRLTSRVGTRWLVATGIVLVVGVAVLGVAQPANLPFGLGFLVLLGLGLGLALSTRTSLDVAQGTVTRRRWLARTRVVRLAEARVALVDNRGGGLNLTVVGPGGTVLAPVLLLSPYVQRSQSPEVLRTMAEAVARHARDAGDVPDALRTQAAHLEQGGEATTSPLAARVSHGASRAAGAGGAASGSSLTDL